MFKILIVSVLLLLPIACSETTDPELGEVFDLAFGQSTQIHNENLSIKFLEVAEDSRCPTSVECVWEGNAGILLLISQDTVSLNTTLEPKEIDIGSYVIELISVSPYPETTEPINKEDYTIELVVTK